MGLDVSLERHRVPPDRLFTYIFIRIENHVPEPIVDLKFFKIPAFVNTLMNNFVVFMGMMGGIFLIPIFAQTFLGYNATQAGYLFIPMAAALMIGAPLGRLVHRQVFVAHRDILEHHRGGAGIFLFSFLDPKSGPLAIILPLVVMAFGWASAWPSAPTSSLPSSTRRRSASPRACSPSCATSRAPSASLSLRRY
ncbi:MAG: MFS transporter [bacterium]